MTQQLSQGNTDELDNYLDSLLNPNQAVETEDDEVESYLDTLLSGQQDEFKVPPTVETEDDEVESYLDTLLSGQDPVQETDEVTSAFAPPPKKKFDRPDDAAADRDVSFEEMSSDAEYMTMLRDYNVKRFGEGGQQRKDETDKEYLERFVTHVREFEFNSLDLASQLDWVRTADTEDRMQFGYLYSQLDRLPDFYEEGGTGYLSAVRDFGKALIFDPLNLISLGAGKAASIAATRSISAALKAGGKQLAIKEAAKLAPKTVFKTSAGKIAAVGVGVESVAAGVQNLKQQEIDILSKKYGDATPEEKSLLSAAGSAAVTGLIGTGFAKYTFGNSNQILTNARQMRVNKYKLLRDYRTRANPGQLAADLSDEATKDTVDIATGIFDVEQGRKALKELGPMPEDPVAQMQFRVELMDRVGRVVTETVQDLANSGQLGKLVDEETKASEVIGSIVKRYMDAAKKKTTKAKGKKATEQATKSVAEQTRRMLEGTTEMPSGDGLLDFIPDNVDANTLANALEGALSRNKLTSEQFINAMGASYTDAGKFLQTASKVGKIMKGLKEVDPELDQALKKFNNPDPMVTTVSRAGEVYRKLDRERRALMVTMVSTTMRNVYSAVTRIGFDGLANSLESVLYQMGRGMGAAADGSIPRVTTLGQGGREAVRDGFGVVARMANTTETAELADSLLSNNPRLLASMNRSLNELAPDKELSKVSRFLNTLNIAQDLFFRRGVFVDTIDKQLRRAGIIVGEGVEPKAGQFKSLEEFAASGKALPSKTLEQAVDESLAFTFARVPKEQGGKAGDKIAYQFLKLNEYLGPLPLPIGTAALPFAKFMVNALQFQFQYSPASVLTGLYQGRLSKLAGKAAEETKRLAALETDKKAKKTLTKLANKQILEAEQRSFKARKDFSTGVVGTAALMTAVNFRANNQNIKWFEYQTEDGKTKDLRPYFPITPYLALADLIVKTGFAEEATLGIADQPEIFAETDVKELLEGIVGAQFRTGASSFVLDEWTRIISGKSDDIKSGKLAELTGKYTAELFGGAATPLRVLRDIEAAYDTEAAKVRDARQVKGSNAVDRGLNAFVNTLQKDMPGVSKSLPEVESPTREGAIYRQSSMVSQLAGLPREEAKRSLGEKELVRLGIRNYSLVPSEGDGEATALVKKYVGKRFEEAITAEINSKSYQSKSTVQQKAIMNNILKQYRSEAKILAKAEAFNVAERKGESFTPFDRAQYGKLPKRTRALVEEYYQDTYGKSVIEMQDAQPKVNHYLNAIRTGRALAGMR
jgi:hypothetical protein